MNDLVLSNIPKVKVNPPHKNKNEVLLRCPLCELIKNRKSRIFRNPQSLFKHLFQSHNKNDNLDYPTVEDTLRLLDTICLMIELRMLVK